jgi:transketolase
MISTGLILDHAIKAVKILQNRGFSIRLLEMPSIKPIDKEAIIKAAQDIGKLVTVEEHTILGGLGGAVAEVLTDNIPTRLTRLGINDVFTESGEYIDLLNKYGLSVENIVRQSEKLILE